MAIVFENSGEKEVLDGNGAFRIAPADDAFDVIAQRAHNVLASTPLEEGEYIAHGLWGHELAARLSDPRRRDDFFVLDIRSREAYEQGHLEGAHHVEFDEWASPENLARYPLDTKIAVISHTGLAAAQVVAGLRLLGFDAIVPKTGINGWTRTPMSERLLEEFKSVSYPVKRIPPADDFIPAAPGAVFEQPAELEYGVIATRAHEVFRAVRTAGAARGHVISAAELMSQLADEDRRQGIFLLDLRREEDFEGVGHIEGSVRMDFDAVAVPENLERLPRDRKIVTICYTGNLAAQLAAVLRLLGFDADALAFGMVGWTRTPTTYLYVKDLEKADNPLV